MPTIPNLALAGLAAFAAGGINAIAGGGTLVSFPALVALGVPSVQANVTNTVALCPGYFGGAMAQRKELGTYRSVMRWLLVIAGAGGLVGSVLLVLTSEEVFRSLVPFLILTACALLGFQDRIRRRLFRHREHSADISAPLVIAVFAAAVYGGYFGAGLGIMLLAVLGVMLDGELNKLNSLKQVLSLTINVVAACFFVLSGKVEWAYAAVMAPTSLAGGHVGGLLAGRMNARILRAVVIVFGVVVAAKMLLT